MRGAGLESMDLVSGSFYNIKGKQASGLNLGAMPVKHFFTKFYVAPNSMKAWRMCNPGILRQGWGVAFNGYPAAKQCRNLNR